jgi:3alpha(or 20beta)-hydroxysteroid dehydrogenase
MVSISEIDTTSRLDGRTALVTGGARGIGEAVCRRLVASGARVLIADLLLEEGQDLARNLGPLARFTSLDVTDEDAWRAAVALAVDWTGRLDILVTCAGIVSFCPIADLSLATFDRVLDVNLVGTFLGLKHAGGAMAAAGKGAIVTLSSTAGLEGGDNMAAYCASKWGVRGLTKVAAIELGAQGVRVNSVHPEPVDTAMVNPGGKARDELRNLSIVKRMPLGRVADPDEIATVCAFLAGDGASFMTGAEIAVDGGATIGMTHPGLPGARPPA